MHDLAAIEYIQRLRRKRVRQIKDSKVFFLTSDRKLTRFAFVENGHRENATISEVIPDRLLTNLLWLRNPESVRNLSIDAMVSVHSRGLFVDKDVWSIFSNTVFEAKRKGLINDSDTTIILYDSNVQSLLLELTPEKAANTIQEQWLIESIKEAKTRLDKEQADALQKQKFAFEAALLEKDERHAKALERLVASFREKVKGKTDREFKILAVASKIMSLIMLLFVFRLVLMTVVKRWSEIEPLAWLISMIFAVATFIVGRKSNPSLLREKVRDGLYSFLLRRNRSMLGVTEIEKQLTETS